MDRKINGQMDTLPVCHSTTQYKHVQFIPQRLYCRITEGDRQYDRQTTQAYLKNGHEELCMCVCATIKQHNLSVDKR